MKSRNQEFRQPGANPETKRRGGGINSFLAGVATILALLALGVGGFIYYRARETGQWSNPFAGLLNRSETPTDAPTTPTTASPSPTSSPANQTSPFTQSALGKKAQVDLVSIKRIPGSPDEVTVDVRISRLADEVTASDTINLSETSARNPITSETYEAVSPRKRSSGRVSLAKMRQDQPQDAYVVLKVPQGISKIDVFIPNTGTFRNALIKEAEPTANGATTSPSNASTASPTPGWSLAPHSTVSPSGTGSTRQGTLPIPGVAALPSPTSGSAEVKPGQFEQLAYGSKAKVELLSVKRIKNPETGKQDAVNVQMRIRRQSGQVGGSNIINVGETTARNPDTSETYKAVNPIARSTGPVALPAIREGASVDAYVWLKVPEGAKTVDIFVPETGAFKKVPISN